VYDVIHMAENESARAAAAAEAAKTEGKKDEAKEAPKADAGSSDSGESKIIRVKIRKDREKSKRSREAEADKVKLEAEALTEVDQDSKLNKARKFVKEAPGNAVGAVADVGKRAGSRAVKKGREVVRNIESDPGFKNEVAGVKWFAREIDFSIVEVVGILTRKATNLVLKPAFSLLNSLFSAMEKSGGDNPWLKWVPGFMKPDAIESEDIVDAPGATKAGKDGK
jgi:hypothetical protein